MATITKDEILKGLRGLGLRPGHVVLAHSSLSSLGYVEGGAETVIDALIGAVSPGGPCWCPH